MARFSSHPHDQDRQTHYQKELTHTHTQPCMYLWGRVRRFHFEISFVLNFGWSLGQKDALHWDQLQVTTVILRNPEKAWSWRRFMGCFSKEACSLTELCVFLVSHMLCACLNTQSLEGVSVRDVTQPRSLKRRPNIRSVASHCCTFWELLIAASKRNWESTSWFEGGILKANYFHPAAVETSRLTTRDHP